MVCTLELKATSNGVIWPRRPLISAKGLLSSLRNLPFSSSEEKPARFRSVAFNATGEILAATDEKGRVFAFFVHANRYALVQHLGVPTITCCFSPVRKTELLVTCENEIARCIDVQSQTLISTLKGHRYPARCASFQRSGMLALTASQDAVILWDTKDWSRFRILNAGPGVEEATFVSRGDLVAVCFQDDTIMMWELETLALHSRFSVPEHEPSPGLRQIAVSDDYQVLVASGRAPFIYVWGFESQTILRIIELPSPVKEVVHHQFLPGHQHTISILGDDGILFFLNAAASKPKIHMEIACGDRKITDFDIEPHSRYLACCTDDGYLLFYDLEIARETSARATAKRRNEGLEELDEMARLAVRSGLREGVSPNIQTQQPKSNSKFGHPVHSKLISRLFGAPVKTPKQLDAAKENEEPSAHTRTPFPLPPQRAASTASSRVTAATSTRPAKQASQQNTPSHSKAKPGPLLAPMESISAEEIRINRKRLEGALKCSGKYPTKYRLLAWRFLLQLPKNETAFRALVNKGSHASLLRLGDRYPLKDQRLLRRLTRVLSAIVYWCPAFGELEYLPALVYPFVKLFRENDLAAFETSLCVLLNYARDFLVSLPYPPVFLLNCFEQLLVVQDAALHDHFVKLDVSAEIYAWSLLKTIFTEVLSEVEWLILWDHLFTYPEHPKRLFVAVLAYWRYFRVALLAASDAFSIEQFFHQQNAIDMDQFIRLWLNLCEKMEPLDSKFTRTGSSESEETDSQPRHWPLPNGQYPAFANYPAFVVNYQLQERNRIAMEEAALADKQQLLKKIQHDTEKLQASHAKWLAEKKNLLEAEEKRQRDMLEQERMRILTMKALDYETQKRRLERLAAMEASAREALEENARLLQAESLRIETELELQKERTAFEIEARKQEEEILGVEFETETRVLDLQKQQQAEEKMALLRQEFIGRARRDEMAKMAKFAEWKCEDEAAQLDRKVRIAHHAKQVEAYREKRLREQLENKLMEQQLEEEKELIKLQNTRAMRKHKEKSMNNMESAMEQQEREQRAPEENEAREEGEKERKEQQRQLPPQRQMGDENGNRNATRRRSSPELSANTDQTQSQPAQTSQPTISTHDDAQRAELDREPTPPSTRAPTSAPKTSGLRMDSLLREAMLAQPGSEVPMLQSTVPMLQSTGGFSGQSFDSGASSSRSVKRAMIGTERTMEEMNLLEKALCDVSGSSSSSINESLLSVHQVETAEDLGLETAPASNPPPKPDPHVAEAAATRTDHAALDASASLQASNAALMDVSRLSSEADTSFDTAPFARSATQRPIHELEKQLGVHFDDESSEEEKDDDDDDVDEEELLQQHRRPRHEMPAEREEELEDDRASLLARARRVLETHDPSL